MSANRMRILGLLLPGLALALTQLAPSAGTALQEQTGKEGQPTSQETAFFEKEVLPILKANCFKCHGEGKTRGGLSLTSRQDVLEGGDHGPAVSLQKPEESR